ncbi:hypothetical protein IQ249_00870 [Lusitaniella coriacea LEGE 07157]|uniref:Uncharacterized protein n=1 Tax=Lusitaniella coriacea LEGE 07157 TaxID=945747 RepID=A0A8J7B2L1_9CYAN|nr:hypothetical protein [Lusitaniella coriacea]MBE9114437.1 hypothetical protein [Lusitaniella coriacea LEGE 07157]
MINREQLKREIDLVNDAYLEILYRIIQAFKIPLTETSLTVEEMSTTNPLKESVIFEGDLISPIDETWID